METPPAPIIAKFRFDDDFLIVAQRRMMRQKRTYWLWQVVRWSFIAGAIVHGAWSLQSGPSNSLSLIPVAFVAVLFLINPWLTEWATRRNFSKSPFRGQLLTATLDEEGYRVRSDHEDTLMRWPLFQKVVHFPDGYLLMQGPLLVNWLPRSAFATPAEADAAGAFLRQVISVHAAVE